MLSLLSNAALLHTQDPLQKFTRVSDGQTIQLDCRLNCP
jgi:hypothetical protein